VKHLRIFILVVLSILLPLRGAVAAAMLCPGGAHTKAAVDAAGHGHHNMQSDHGMHEHHAAPHDHASNHASDNDSSTTDAHANTCQFCASGGCVTPIAPPPSAVASPLLTSSVMFPALSAPAAAFLSGGQDRPPRTI
jgi:hypothetical protein